MTLYRGFTFHFIKPNSFLLLHTGLELLVSEDQVKQAEYTRIVKANVLKDVNELKERMKSIVEDKKVIHDLQIKAFNTRGEKESA